MQGKKDEEGGGASRRLEVEEEPAEPPATSAELERRTMAKWRKFVVGGHVAPDCVRVQLLLRLGWRRL